MPFISAAYRGPLVILALGVGFAAVGAVPVAVTISLGTRSSATIIGMGFVGFGCLLMLPGAFWCLMVRTHSFKTWRRRLHRGRTTDENHQRTDDDDDEDTPALQSVSIHSHLHTYLDHYYNQFIKQKDRSATYINVHEIHIEIV